MQNSHILSHITLSYEKKERKQKKHSLTLVIQGELSIWFKLFFT